MRYTNKKAFFNFQILETWSCGIVLVGSEVKSIFQNGFNFQDSYAYVNNGEVFLKGTHIPEYKNSTMLNHQVDRERKLLLNKKEIKKIESLLDKGLTLVATSIFANDKGYIKVELSLAKGKKLYDKRESIKEKDLQRELTKNIE